MFGVPQAVVREYERGAIRLYGESADDIPGLDAKLKKDELEIA